MSQVSQVPRVSQVPQVPQAPGPTIAFQFPQVSQAPQVPLTTEVLLAQAGGRVLLRLTGQLGTLHPCARIRHQRVNGNPLTQNTVGVNGDRGGAGGGCLDEASSCTQERVEAYLLVYTIGSMRCVAGERRGGLSGGGDEGWW